MALRRDLSKKVEEECTTTTREAQPHLLSFINKIHKEMKRTTYSSKHTQNHSSIEHPSIMKHPQDNIFMREL
jgi:hypothetical protein